MKICKESVQSAIDSQLQQVVLTEPQKQAILAQCRPSVTVARPHVRVLKRAVAVVAAAALFVVGGVGVLAQSPGLAQRLGHLGEHTLSLLQPVQQVAVDDGIRMEVLAALNDEEVAVVYLTLQDTTGQGRVTPDVDLRHVQIQGAAFSHAQVIDFDERSGTATICLTGEGGQLAGHPVSVQLRSFLRGWTYQTDAGPNDLDAAALAALDLPTALDPAPQTHGYSSNGPMSLIPEEGDLPILAGAASGPELPGVPWAQVTAAGVLGDQLHIQLLHSTELSLYNDVTFYFTDAAGTPLDTANAVVALGEEIPIAPHWTVCRTQEHILQLPAGVPPRDLRLHYDVAAYQACQKGVWNVGFTLEPAGETLALPCAVSLPGWDLEQVEISALGVTLIGREIADQVISPAQIRLVLQDGSEAQFWSSSFSWNDDQVISRDLFTRPLDLSQIQALYLDDIPVPLTP